MDGDSAKAKKLHTRLPRPAVKPGDSNVTSPHRKSDEEFRFMADSLPLLIFMYHPDGTIEYLNKQWAEYTGLPLESIQTVDRANVIHPDDLPEFIRLWYESIQSGKEFSFEHRLRRHDGKWLWHRTTANAMRDSTGEIIKWFGACANENDSRIAAQREKELVALTNSLTQQREELITLNSAKDEFISLASHQLRTPATIVKQYLNMIMDGLVGSVSGELEHVISRASLSNDRQIEIVDDLLRVARLDAGKVKLVKHTVNIVPLIQEVVLEQALMLEAKGQEAIISYDEPGINTAIDSPRMKMVLENLIDNASKYSDKNTKIEIYISQTKRHISIAIKDQGIGIAKKDIPKLFQKFSRLYNDLSVAVSGTGLGLYWAKRIVDLHSGSITVTSGKTGATFTIVLPRTKKVPHGGAL